MRYIYRTLILSLATFFVKAQLLLAQENTTGNATESHTSTTTTTTTYTILGMDRTTGILVILGVIVVLAIIIALSRRSSSTTTVVKLKNTLVFFGKRLTFGLPFSAFKILFFRLLLLHLIDKCRIFAYQFNIYEMALNSELLEKLACPSCGYELTYSEISGTLSCTREEYVFRIENNVPVMIAGINPKEISGGSFSDLHFDYLKHYTVDSWEFDYFDEQAGATEHSERRLRENILSQIPVQTFSILDVGSGSAWVAKHFHGSDIFICSLDATIVNTSKALEKFRSVKHSAIVADAFNLPFKEDAFDCVLAAEIIEHIPDPKGFIHSLLRVIKPGGTLIISTPYREVIQCSLCIHCNQKTPYNSHLHSFDEKKLRALFVNENITRFQWEAFNNKLLLFARAHVILRYAPFRLWRIIDKMANRIFNKPVNIVLRITK
jgi:SAM-dependent methyltransferase